MHPAEETKLLLEVSAFQREHKADETDQIQREADETVVRREWRELGVGKHDMLLE